jgi:DNA polymerase III delta prime subunit
MRELWTEKYRPKKLSEYVFRDSDQKRKCFDWVKDGALPHLLLSGTQGVGKTSLAYVLLNELGVKNGDILKINASQENNVDTIREKVVNFASTMPFGDYDFKYVVLDEADYLSLSAQAVLRGVTEQYHNNCRFILTCNYPQKIIPALSNSRCQRFHIEKLDFEEFLMRMITILQAEGVAIATAEDVDILNTFVQAAYPDLRKCINDVQNNVIDGRLVKPNSSDTSGSQDYKVAAIDLFKKGKITEARKMIVEQAKADEYEELYTMFYRNLDWWGDKLEQQDEAILVIRDGLYKHALVCDPEINLSATIVSLAKIRRG